MYAIAGWVDFPNATHLPCRGKGTNMLKILVAEWARREGMPLEESSALTTSKGIDQKKRRRRPGGV